MKIEFKLTPSQLKKVKPLVDIMVEARENVEPGMIVGQLGPEENTIPNIMTLKFFTQEEAKILIEWKKKVDNE